MVSIILSGAYLPGETVTRYINARPLKSWNSLKIKNEIMSNQKELAGRAALVTGAARNLGRGFAEALGSNGADVAVHYNSPQSKSDAEETAQRVRAHGGKAIIVSGD